MHSFLPSPCLHIDIMKPCQAMWRFLINVCCLQKGEKCRIWNIYSFVTFVSIIWSRDPAKIIECSVLKNRLKILTVLNIFLQKRNFFAKVKRIVKISDRKWQLWTYIEKPFRMTAVAQNDFCVFIDKTRSNHNLQLLSLFSSSAFNSHFEQYHNIGLNIWIKS